MKKKRSAGILLPITSLPCRHGIGTMGKEAYAFVDFLKKAGQTYWQILPVGPTSFGDSPYQSFSTFAGNPYFIDPDLLIDDGLLTESDCKKAGLEPGSKTDKSGMYVDYALQYYNRYPLLKKAYDGFLKKELHKSREYKAFCEENEDWLPEYTLFMALKDENDGIPFTEWERDLRVRKKKAVAEAHRRLIHETGFYAFLQFEFFKQWKELKKYANANGISIIGDIPIYVAADSADVWGDPELFVLDKDNLPVAVAGCPPDYFAKTGQLWGNPLYNWEYHKKTGYSWWISRMRRCFELYDCVRIDHFRGFDEYYAIPYKDPTAEFGKWQKGPGLGLFDAIKASLGELNVIAEDLGFMTSSVKKMVKKSGFPNMKVLLFGFGPEGDSEYLPHNYERNCVVYTGTHDNDTAMGYYKRAGRKEKAFAREYLGISSGRDFDKAVVRAALSSIADTAIIPMQDYLGLDNSARINLPSTLGGINWQWRLMPGQLTDELAARIKTMTFVYGRCEKEDE
ncbi:MAG: 4-alpha-glucanotransferase [Lachnospiraceae bacterium]|nr:4-alpha-glucanotransferase [Lachnospiraceae bacterium]